MLYNLHFFSSKCRLFLNATLFGFCITHILNTGCAKIWKKVRRQKVNVHCLRTEATVECEAYGFPATAHSRPNFLKKKFNNFLEMILSNEHLFPTAQNTCSIRDFRPRCVPTAQGTLSSTRILVTVLVSCTNGRYSGFVPLAFGAYYLNRRININICIKSVTHTTPAFINFIHGHMFRL